MQTHRKWFFISAARMLIAALFVVTAFGLGAAAPVQAATTLCVDPGSTPTCYATIPEALVAASAGDTIQVAAGTYTQKLSINKPVTIIGAGEGQTVINLSAYTGYGIEVLANNIHLEGFTLIGTGTSSSSYAIKVSDNNFAATQTGVVIKNVTVQNSYKTGLDLNGVADSTIENVTVKDTVSGAGILMTDSNRIILRNITVERNPWGGVSVQTCGKYSPAGSDGVTFEGTFAHSGNGPGGTSDNPFYLEEGCSQNGGYVAGANLDVTNLTLPAEFTHRVRYHRVPSTYTSWFSGFAGSAEDAQAFIAAAGAGMANPTIQDLDSGEFIVFPGMTIQDAINAAPSGGVVKVAAGTYNESPTINKPLTLESIEGRDATTIVLKPAATYMSALTINTEGAVTVDGFTIQGFDAVGDGYASTNLILTTLPDEVVIKNNRIQVGKVGSNTNGDDGFGILNYYTTTADINTLTVTGNIFEPVNDEGTRAFYINPGVNHFVFTDNLIDGKFAYSALTQAKDGLLEGNTINSLGGSGFGTWGYPDAAIYGHTTFRENLISGTTVAIGINESNQVLVENNIFENTEVGVRIKEYGLTFDPATIHIRKNILAGSTVAGVDNTVTAAVDAACNWWGELSGPTLSGNPGGSGAALSGTVTYAPWMVYADDASPDLGWQLPAAFTLTPAGEVSMAENDFRVLANAISCVQPDQTVTLSGTFDWSQPLAEASWALGADGKTASDDDYWIMAPANTDGVTLTADSLGAAVIQGPGDLPEANLEGFFGMWNPTASSNQNWTISNLEILDFDLGLGFYNGGRVDQYTGMTIENNHIRVARDLNSFAASTDVNQNIGIHFSFGKNQTITGNIIDLYGDGESYISGSSKYYATEVAMQSNTSGGTAYDGLKITNNTVNVLYAQKDSGVPERIFGIWENGHAHQSNIEVTGNTFNNLAAGNDPTKNLQIGFRGTSHSSAATAVNYSGNTANGAQIGFAWLAVSGTLNPVQFADNTADNSLMGLTLYDPYYGGPTQARLNVVDFTYTGPDSAPKTAGSVGIRGYAGTTLTVEGASLQEAEIGFAVDGGTAALTESIISGNDTGIKVMNAGTLAMTQNNVFGNSSFGLNNTTAAAVDAKHNWWGTINGPAHASNTFNVGFQGNSVGGSAAFVPWLDAGYLSGVDFAPVTTTSPAGMYSSIQAGVNGSNVGGVVSAAAGAYDEDVDVNKALTLRGAGMDESIVRGVAGGNTATVDINANGVVLEGFTITRLGNNLADWNTSLNLAGVALQTVGNAEIRNNKFTGNRTAIDINDSDGNTIHNNILDFNRTGLVLRNACLDNIVEENAVTNNWTAGVLWLAASTEDATGTRFFNNNISGNWYTQIENRSLTASTKDFSGNYLGAAELSIVNTNGTEPGYAALIPVEFGGTATPPGNAVSVRGAGLALMDYSPWLGSGADSDLDAVGFQSDFMDLYVDDDNSQSGSAGRIPEAVTLAAKGATIHAAEGNYPAQVVISKDLTLFGDAQKSIIQAVASMPACSGTHKPVVCVKDGAVVELHDFTIDGRGLGNTNYKFDGVAFFNAGGAVEGSWVKDIRDTPFSGTQHGVGIYAYNTDDVARTLDVTDNTITGFQKNAMALNAGDTTPMTVNVLDNQVTGAGATTITAQNGIQVYMPAGSGVVSGNTITGIAYDNTNASTPWVATSILNYYTDLETTDNVISGSHMGIYYYDGQGLIDNNDLTIEKVGVNAYGIVATDPPQAVPSPFEQPERTLTREDAVKELVVTVSNNTVHFNGDQTTATYGIEADGGYGPDNIQVTVSKNKVDGFEMGLVFYQCEAGCASGVFSGITAAENNLTGNETGLYLGGLITIDPLIHHNRFFDNGTGLQNDLAASVTAENNWWGCNEGPGKFGCDTAAGLVDASPWLVMKLTADPALILPGTTTTFTSDLFFNNAGENTSTAGFVPDGTPVKFYEVGPREINPIMTGTLAGKASTTYTAPVDDLEYGVCALVDEELSCAYVTVDNVKPAAAADSYTTVEDGSGLVVAAAESVLKNDTDANGDTLTALVKTQPAHGSLTFNSDGTFTYVPEKDFTGEDNFTYAASDGKLESDAAAVTIEVTNVNDTPVAADIDDVAWTAEQDNETTIPAFSDVDGDTLAYTATLANGDPLPGWLNFDADTLTFSGAPVNADAGVYAILVEASDGHGGTASTTFNLVVASIPVTGDYVIFIPIIFR